MPFALDSSNLESIRNSISPDNPAGVDLRADKSPQSLYYQIRDFRNKARNLERENFNNTDQLSASLKESWQNVAQLAIKALTQYSKDLEIVAWLIESLIRINGFQGLALGFQTAKQLIENFSSNAYPLGDDEDTNSRLMALAGLNGIDSKGTLIAPILMQPLTEGKDIGPFCGWHYEQALEIATITDAEKKQQRLANGAVSLEMLQQAAGQTSATFFCELHSDLQNCLTEFSQLNSLLALNYGVEAPPSSNVSEALNKCLECLNFIAKDKLSSLATEIIQDGDSEKQKSIPTITMEALADTAKITNRIQAFKILSLVADFFLRTEPHSPLGYNLQQLIRWGNMPLPELLSYLIPDNNARNNFCLLAGIEQRNNSST